jgi:hypothetical protein
MTILEENHHSFLIAEHDLQLFRGCREENGGVPGPSALRQTSREATILLYAPALDPHLQKIKELADRVFCIYNEQAPAKSRKLRRRCRETRELWRHTREVVLEAAEGDRAQADGKQGHGAADSQGDPGRGLPRPARRGAGDDKEQAGGELAIRLRASELAELHP